jgi:CxxC-x17-CxxC domain-containing protein
VRDFKRDNKPQGGRDFKSRDFDKPQTMFKTICSDCGKECEVPFKPNGSKPVFCRDCFQSKRRFEGARENSPRPGNFPPPPPPRRPDFEDRGPHQPPVDPHKQQFEALNSKLDKILSLLAKEEPIREIAEAIKEDVVLTSEPKVKKPVARKKKVAKK